MQNPAPILVIAATGKTGRRVADRLEAKGHRVRRGSRSGADQRGTRSSFVRFDWDDPSTWGPALAGAEAAYIVYSPDLAVPAAPPAIRAFCEAARAAGVKRLVLLSGRGEEEAQRCERIVLESGLDATVVRASWFAQNFSEGAFAPLVQAGEIALPAGDIPEPFIDIDDIADVAVAALCEPGHAGEIYEVTGPRAMTFAEAIAELGAASGRELTYRTIPVGHFTAGLTAAGLDAEEVGLLEYLFTTVLDGRNAHTSDGVERALGRPARDFREYARAAAGSGAWDVSPQSSRPQPAVGH